MRLEVTQHFAQPLQIVVRQNMAGGAYRDVKGTKAQHQVIEYDLNYQPQPLTPYFNSNVTDIFKNQYLSPRPYRVCFGTGDVSRHLGSVVKLGGEYGREIPGGAGQMLSMPLHPDKQLQSLTLRTLSPDVVIGLMAVTLQ